MLKACSYDVRKALIRDLLISFKKTRDFEWQTAHTKGCQENRCVRPKYFSRKCGDFFAQIGIYHNIMLITGSKNLCGVFG